MPLPATDAHYRRPFVPLPQNCSHIYRTNGRTAGILTHSVLQDPPSITRKLALAYEYTNGRKSIFIRAYVDEMGSKIVLRYYKEGLVLEIRLETGNV